MKYFTEKGIMRKIIIAIVFVVLINFISPTVSSADFGGILFEPIKELLLVIADGAMALMQNMILGINMDNTFLEIQDPSADTPAILGWVTGILIAVGTVAVIIATGGAAALAILAIGATTAFLGAEGMKLYVTKFMTDAIPLKFKLPMFMLAPEDMFSNKVPALDVNFFEDGNAKGAAYDEDGKFWYVETTTVTGEKAKTLVPSLTLQPHISKWYYTLRNFAIVALLSILVYIGIRIVISSAAEDKARYKERLKDWLVAMCLLFFMHYVMAFAVTLTESITSAVNSLNGTYMIWLGNKDGSKLSDYEYGNGSGNAKGINIWSEDSDLYKTFEEKGIIQELDLGRKDEEGHTVMDTVFMWPTNLMGRTRMELQMDYTQIENDTGATGEDGEEATVVTGNYALTQDANSSRQFGYVVLYLALVIYTMLFLFRYLKRLLMLAFLTVIAPLMAMTYPLDKMHDGSAQGLTMWFKEYIFNLLIQPVHLILYTLLIGSALDLMADNIILALVALGFILQAEKLLRKFFGFDKASTVASGSALGGALAMQGINQIGKLLGKGNKESKSGGTKQVNSGNSTRRLSRGKDSGANPYAALSSGSSNSGQGSSGGQALEPEDKTAGQRMVDADDENFLGMDAMALQERDANAREAYGSTQNDNGMSRAEYANLLRASGYDEKELEKELNRAYGKEELPETDSSNVALETPTLESPSEGPETSSTKPVQGTSNSRIRRAGRKIWNGTKMSLNAVRYTAPKAALLTAKKAARIAVKGSLMAAGATVGLAAGLVSDDFSNVAKFAAAGAGSGLLAGKGISSPLNSKSLKEEFAGRGSKIYNASHTGAEIEARENKKADKEFLKDEKAIQFYQEELGISRKEAREKMKKEVMTYRKNGITDDKIIAKAMKTKDEKFFGAQKDSAQRIALAQMATQVGGNQKELEYVQKGLERRGLQKKDYEKYINQIRKMNKWM